MEKNCETCRDDNACWHHHNIIPNECWKPKPKEQSTVLTDNFLGDYSNLWGSVIKDRKRQDAHTRHAIAEWLEKFYYKSRHHIMTQSVNDELLDYITKLKE